MANPNKEFALATRRSFQEAWQFDQVARQLEHVKPKRGKVFYPWPVNQAFALEVYLKCLHAIEQNHCPPKHHFLSRLYAVQTAKSRDVIEGLYNKRLATQPQGFRQEMKTVLRLANDAFKVWRYRYEEGAKPDPFSTNVAIVCDAVRERIIQLRPRWKSYIVNDLS